MLMPGVKLTSRIAAQGAVFATVVGLAVAMQAGSASAAITFDHQAQIVGGKYYEDGYVFSAPVGLGNGDFPSGNCPTGQADCLKLDLSSKDQANAVKMTTDPAGGVFDLLGLDVTFNGGSVLSIWNSDHPARSPASNPGDALEFCVVGTCSGSNVYTSDNIDVFTLISTSGGDKYYTLDFTGLGSVFTSFFTGKTAFYFDNDARDDKGKSVGTLRIDNLSPVPLPAALPLMLVALGSFGFFACRRKAA